MNPQIGFELEKIEVPLEQITPVRLVKDPRGTIERYKTIVDSIKLVGLIEPLMVYPKDGKIGYFLVDGHLRLCALKELGRSIAECIISKDDESFTYNARINRISPIQEHRMIVKAVQNGLKPDQIAQALSMPLSHVRSLMNLLHGIDEKAAELLKDKAIAPLTFRLLRKVKGSRQIEMVELMMTMNDYSSSYAEVLVLATPKEHLVKPEEEKTKKGLSPEEIAMIEQEMEALQQDVNKVQQNYGDNVLSLTVIKGYIKKLLNDAKIVRFLTTNYPEYLVQFESIAATESF